MKYLSLIFALLLTTACFAQQKQYVFLLKNNGDKVHTKDSMDYIRVVKGPVEGPSKLYDVTEYYPSGKPKSVGQTSGIDPLVREGAYTIYWPNGNIKATATYKQGKIYGDESHFFSNGQLHSVITYTQSGGKLKDNDAQSSTIYLKTCNDSTGKALLVAGNGYFADYDENLKINEEGTVKDGKRVGAWKGGDEKNQTSFTETYDDNGKLISGTSKDSAGVYTYTQRHVSAQPKGGPNEFYRNYIGQTIHYPVMARRNNIQGTEIIHVSITADGKLTNFQILQSLSPEIDQECIRVLGLSPRWQPAMAFGRSVTATSNIPISFTMLRQ